MEVLGAGKKVNRGSEVKERSRKGQGHCSVILHPRLPHIFLLDIYSHLYMDAAVELQLGSGR